MPVSYVPSLLPVALFAAPLLALVWGRRAALKTMWVSGAILAAIFLATYAPGWYLSARAHAGNARAQFDYARWCENHCGFINNFIIWPCEPQVQASYFWLEKAAAQDYPPAIYAVGVRLKYGWHVPPWSDTRGNHFPQPFVGQMSIDRALDLGYRPPVPEKEWWAWWRRIR